MDMTDVLVIGGVFREVFLGSQPKKFRYGGSGLVAAITAARLNARTALAGYVGSEDEDSVRTELLIAGVDDAFLVTVSGASGTFLFPRVLDPVTPWPLYRPAESVPDSLPILPDAKVVLAFGIPDFDPVAQGWLTDFSRTATIIWDRQGWISRARNSENIISLPFARKIYLGNRSELDEDASDNGNKLACATKPPLGFDSAIIKNGAKGVEVLSASSSRNCRNTIPAFPVKSTSTIGSGDVFAGAFAARLTAGDSYRLAATWGCAAASASIHSGTNLIQERHAALAQSWVESRVGN